MFVRLIVTFCALLAWSIGLPHPASAAASTEKATFAGGCFWCMEEAFEGVEGVLSVVSGYTGGTQANPSYEQVSAGITGHAEAVEIVFDPSKVTYGKLLERFWANVDPTTPDRQFCDRGTQYRPAIFYHSEQQKKAADDVRQRIEQTKTFPDALAVQTVAATPFYPAEEYHQDFYKKNPIRYKFYKFNCGRVQRLEELWGKKTG